MQLGLGCGMLLGPRRRNETLTQGRANVLVCAAQERRILSGEEIGVREDYWRTDVEKVV